MRLPLLFTFLCALCVVAPAWASDDPRDPWQGMNRKVFAFNDAFDRHLATPVAKGYQAVTPVVVDTAVTAFFRNLGDVTNSVNFALQGDGAQSLTSLQRVVGNTMVGVGGLIDIASLAGVPRRETDFGVTLGKWGAGSGPFLVLPFWGASSPRDAAGLGVDLVISPLPEPLTVLEDDTWRLGLQGLQLVDRRADLLQYEQALIGDRYSFLRDLYLQNRDYQINGKPAEDPFLDEADDE